MQSAQPYIITLRLNQQASAYFDSLRQKYFPPAINYLSAHLTLFHHLPSTEKKVKDDLQRWAEQTKSFPLQVTAVVSIGKGVAFRIESDHLMQLHKRMQLEWQQWLTPQDKQKLWPHVTVQNKVAPAAAKQTLATLQAAFQPFGAQALGFTVWYYQGGPWQRVDDYLFADHG